MKKLSQHEKLVFTLETKFALSMLVLPGLIIAARTLSLYYVDEVILLTVFGLGYFALRAVQIAPNSNLVVKRAVPVIQCVFALGIAALVTEVSAFVGSELGVTLFSLVLLGLCADQVTISDQKQWKSMLFNFTSWVLVLGNALMALTGDSLIYQVGSLIVSLAVGFAAFNLVDAKAENSRIVAAIGAISSVIMIVWKFVALAQFSGWMIFGIIGILLIVGASLYERFGLRLSRHIEQ